MTEDLTNTDTREGEEMYAIKKPNMNPREIRREQLVFELEQPDR